MEIIDKRLKQNQNYIDHVNKRVKEISEQKIANFTDIKQQEQFLNGNIIKLDSFKGKMVNKQFETDNLINSKNIFQKNIKVFTHQVDDKYESILDKKIRELKENLSITEPSDVDMNDIATLMIFGQLKVLMDLLNVAEDLGRLIIVNYLINEYKLDIEEAKRIDILHKEIKEMVKQQKELIDKGIVKVDSFVDNGIHKEIEVKRELIFDISKNITNDKVFKDMENKHDIKELIDKYKEQENKVEEHIQGFATFKLKEILMKNLNTFKNDTKNEVQETNKQDEGHRQ